MAHPSREENFDYLRSMLGDVPFSIDFRSQGEWWNCRRAWFLYDKTADWHVVIQDDAVICENFVERAIETINKSNELLNGDHICNFYYGKIMSAIKEASDALKKGYWVNSYPKWGVAICMPTKYIEEMVEFCDKLDNKSHGTRDDSRIAKFCGFKKLKVFFPMPSIIDHRHGKSLVGDPGEGRSAYAFIDKKNG